MRLLLDVHLPLAVRLELRREGIDVEHLSDWLGGQYRNAPDDRILHLARGNDRTLVTYDLRTIPTLLKELIERGEDHGGAILVDGRSIRSDDVGGILYSLRIVVAELGEESWRNRVVYLRRKEN